MTTALQHIKLRRGSGLYQVCRKGINIVDAVTNELTRHISLSHWYSWRCPQKELCEEPWQQTRQVIINKHLLGLLDCSGHETKAAAFKEQQESESDAPCVLGDASLCRKAASQRSVRSSTNPIPLTASIYSDEPDTDGKSGAHRSLSDSASGEPRSRPEVSISAAIKPRHCAVLLLQLLELNFWVSGLDSISAGD